MKFTVSWLREHLDFDASLEELSETLTAIGLEVEEIIDRSEELAPFKIAEIKEAEKHPNADKLQVCKVDNGTEILQIVCGAPNARAGIKVCLAEEGAWIPAGEFKIKKSKIRDVESNGMLCAAAELDLGEDSAGIMELPADAPVGEPFASTLGYDDPMIEIAITPNRGDCLGVYGIARDLAAGGFGTLKPIVRELIEDTFESPINVVTDTKGCPFFLGRYIRNVENKESPEWLQKRLKSIGKKSINALVDITNYLTFAYGRPAHVFDADKLQGDLVVRSATEGEKFVGLDEIEYTLSEGMTVVADDAGVQAVGGILGGLHSGAFEDTKNVYVEIALFDPINIATSGRKLQIDSDARYRFERTVDPHFADVGMNLATQMIQDICGGEASHLVAAGNVPDIRKRIVFDAKDAKTVLGAEINEKQCIDILVGLGFEVGTQGKLLDVQVPSWRSDVAMGKDLIEEIARIYGYDNIPAEPMPPADQFSVALTPEQRIALDVKRLLASRGLREAVTFSFVSEGDATLFANDNALIPLANPISSELGVMRPSVYPHLIRASEKNRARNVINQALFELGPVFEAAEPKKQSRVAAGIRRGQTVKKEALSAARDVDVFDVKADAIAVLGQYVSTDNLAVKRDVPSYYHPGKSGALCLGNQVLAYFGELHPATCAELDVDEAIYGFEVFVDKAPKPKKKKGFARAKWDASNLQAVERDFAFLVDANTEVQDIKRAVSKVDKNLITDVTVFDIYQGEGIAEDKKSVAFSITMQPQKETLTDEQIENVYNNVVAAVAKATGGELRS